MAATNPSAPEVTVEQVPTAPNSQPAQNDAIVPAPAAIPESRMPTKKDTSLREFLSKMDDYAPITDPRLARLLALATQKFIADISADAYQYSRIRASNTNANNPMGNLGAAAGFPIPGQQAGGAQPGKDQSRGGPLLGIQRAGYGGGGSGGTANRTILSIEDLGMALAEYGVNVKRSEFYR
ncbi:unnamed protein product [Parascedosporium putredinis]|uniref:Transcription initiation factor TFIID subunit 10 n=1 Tax=Parascedosporium putredinis TaxID=1442378 RepID=A0A9P1H8S2_9PEZI|nr:unnamed protein product [Parascedosporium putredinis]CAI7999687.1 unnamed protein product [Parascedosporium putredinis]